MSIKSKTKEEVHKSFTFAKRKPFYPVAFVVMAIIFSLVVIPSPLAQVEGYTIVIDEAVDADSNIDATANIGDDAATSYVEAQSQNDVDQTISEGQGAGYVAGNDVEDYFDAVTDSQSPSDVGTYVPNWTNMQSKDDTDSTLTEANTGGSGGTTEYIASAFTDSISRWNSEANAYDGNWGTATNYNTGAYATADAYPSAYASGFDSGASGTGTITQVDIIVRHETNGLDNSDQWGISLDVGASTGNYLQAMTTSNYALANQTFTDVSEPNDASWSWAEIQSAQIHFDEDKIGGGDKGNWLIYELSFKVTTAGADNYEFDREFSFSSLDFDETNEELCIFTGTIGSETLDIDVWEASAWTDIGTDIVDANDDTWVNISISTWLDSTTEYFRFQGSSESSDTTQTTWGIDAILIHSWTDETNDYELEWEHQTNVDIHKDGYMLTLYGYYSDTTEEIQIQMWDWVGTQWDTALATQITETEQWYNISISSSYVDTTNEWITYRFTDTDKALSSDQDTLYLDYSGVREWNMSTYWHTFTLSPTNITPSSSYIPFTDSPLSFQIEAGATYDVQIKGTDISQTPVASAFIYFNTVDDSGTSTLLTTSYQNLITSQSAGNNTHTVYFWINVGWSAGDPAMADSYNKFTVTVYIVPA